MEISFNLQRSWDSPFKAFLLSHDRYTLSSLSLRSGASLQNPLRPRTDAPAAYSHRKSRAPLTATQRISSGRGHMLSWAFWPLRLSPLSDPDHQHLPDDLPLSILRHEYLAIPTPMILRDVRPKKSGVLPKGMPAYLAFSTNCIRHLLRKSTACGVFFHLTGP